MPFEWRLKRLVNPPCLACSKRGLVSHPARVVVEAIESARRVNPQWSYKECVHCGARFKEEHYDRHRRLLPVTDEEWDKDVWVRDQK